MESGTIIHPNDACPQRRADVDVYRLDPGELGCAEWVSIVRRMVSRPLRRLLAGPLPFDAAGDRDADQALRRKEAETRVRPRSGPPASALLLGEQASEDHEAEAAPPPADITAFFHATVQPLPSAARNRTF